MSCTCSGAGRGLVVRGHCVARVRSRQGTAAVLAYDRCSTPHGVRGIALRGVEASRFLAPYSLKCCGVRQAAPLYMNATLTPASI